MLPVIAWDPNFSILLSQLGKRVDMCLELKLNKHSHCPLNAF